MRIIVITGYERSGSTLLERLLVEGSGGMAVGEAHQLYARGIIAEHLCSCGQSLQLCDFWAPSLRSAFGDWERAVHAARSVDASGVLELRNALWPGRRVFPRRRQAACLVKQLYRGLCDIASASHDCIIDSSKNPSWALLLQERFPGDVFVVHLRRDVRGCVYSELKVAARDSRLTSDGDLMLRSSSLRTCFDWLIYNLAAERVGFDYFVRYEDLVMDHETAIHALLTAAGIDRRGAKGAAHSFSGNPMRFTEQLVVTPDVQWMTALGPWQSLVGNCARALLEVLTRLPGISGQKS